MKNRIPNLTDTKVDFSKEALALLHRYKDLKILDTGVTYRTVDGDIKILGTTIVEPTEIRATWNGLEVVLVYSDKNGKEDTFRLGEVTAPRPYVTCMRDEQN